MFLKSLLCTLQVDLDPLFRVPSTAFRLRVDIGIGAAKPERKCKQKKFTGKVAGTNYVLYGARVLLNWIN